MKKFKKAFKKMPKRILALVLVLAIILNFFKPITALAFGNTETLTITFRNNYDTDQGYVEYSLNDGASWVTVNSSINNQAIALAGDNLRIRVVANSGYRVDFAGMSYREDDEDPRSLNDQANSPIAGGLTSSNGYFVTSTATSVALEQVEFRENNGGQGGGQGGDQGGQTGGNFDGRAVVLWSCGSNNSKVCYHKFDVVDPDNCNQENPESEACAPEIGNFDDGNSTFFRDTSIEADNRPGETFNVDAEYREWYLTGEFDSWLNLYREATGSDVDWNTLDPDLIMGDPNQNMELLEQDAAGTCGAKPSEEATEQVKDAFNDCIHLYAAQVQHDIWTHELQPVGEPDAKNAYVSYGDRNFKVVIYNSDYRGVTTGDLTGLTYYPSAWADPYLRTDQYDISETTAAKPALLDSILLERTVNINALEWNNFEIASITPLDVPADAVTVNKVGNKFSIVFTSHFYDNVVFKVTDTSNHEYYIKIKRYTIDAWFDHDQEGDFLRADFYYAKNKSYTDFDITAKIVYKNGSTKLVTLTPQARVDDGLGNFTENYYIDQEYPDSHMDPQNDDPIGKGLKLSTFRYVLEDGEKDTIQDIYMNAEYKGNDPNVYPGAYSGSGEGTLANIIHPEEGE